MSIGSEGIGLIPAAGQNRRLLPYRAWKELISVGYRRCDTGTGNTIVPKVLVEYSLERMHHAGVRQVVVVVNERKAELMRFLGDGHQYGLSLAYVCQESETPFYGMPIAINQAYWWLRGRTVFMAMPDTVIEPDNCFKRLWFLHQASRADLTLGVFPTNCPTRLAPVAMGRGGRVRSIRDKPKTTKIYNTWNIAIWSGNFTELVREHVERHLADTRNARHEILLSDLFNSAIAEKLRVYGEYFKDGKCQDFGNIEDLVILKRQFELPVRGGVSVR